MENKAVGAGGPKRAGTQCEQMLEALENNISVLKARLDDFYGHLYEAGVMRQPNPPVEEEKLLEELVPLAHRIRLSALIIGDLTFGIEQAMSVLEL